MSFVRPDILRPPSEASSYFLPFTKGCANNSCTFCHFYGCHLQIRDLKEIKNEIDALAQFIKHGLQTSGMLYTVYAIASEWDGRRVFIQDGDALVYPFEQLKEGLRYLNQKFPNLERVASYATTQDILRLSLSELKELKELKMGIIYLGVETGDENILQQIGKGVTFSQIVEAGRRIKEAGILSSVTVLLGLGGQTGSREHALATARILTDMDPDYVGALTLTLIPGTPMYQDWKSGKFIPITPMQTLQELKILVENAVYSRCFFSSMHASNYLSVRGILPDQRQSLLAQIERVIQSRNPALLRPEYMRGL
ncbi:MAG TPA: radical SAM protein [Dehalococcoidales bacterium]|nr:radical SAM protein [Dehalococcoidales bacterium]